MRNIILLFLLSCATPCKQMPQTQSRVETKYIEIPNPHLPKVAQPLFEKTKVKLR